MRVITGSARGTKLAAPKGMDTRPTMDQVKEGLFSAIQFEIEGRRALDLFAGSGQLGIEALSRGAASAVFVDEQKEACEIIRQNLQKTKLQEKGSVVQGDYASFLTGCRQKFDLIFLDPPYAGSLLENSLKTISEIDILTDSGIIICERPQEKQLSGEFPGLVRYRDYRYGKTAVTIFRKNIAGRLS
jgi:16S rRNA (guanine966-N2)-methyltransferase